MLKDILRSHMKIVFCGTAVGNKSAELNAYYASPSNRFWATLHQVGLTPYKITPSDYEAISSFRLGLTDLAKFSKGADKNLQTSVFDCGALTKKILRYQPIVLCFNGKKAAKEYLKTQNIEYGFNEKTIGSTKIFVAPSTSGAACGHWEEKWWFYLSDYVGDKVKKVNLENFYEPDEVCKLMRNLDLTSSQEVRTTEADFINEIKDIELHYSLPLELRNMFEIAKGLFAYGFLHYHFFTLALEQALKTLEATISAKNVLTGGPQIDKRGKPKKLYEKIEFLHSKGLISEDFKELLHSYREVRNEFFHPRFQQSMGHYSEYLRRVSKTINSLWTS